MRVDGMQTQVFRGVEVSKNIICVYGWYQNRPLVVGEIESVSEPENEIEVRKCSLVDYSAQYLEAAEEVQEIIEDKIVIFNSAELIPIYKTAKSVKHLSPTMRDVASTQLASKPPELKSPTFKSLSPVQEGLCERCGKTSFLSHQLTEVDGAKSLICNLCVYEIKQDMDIKRPVGFETTLEERREMLKGSEGDVK